MYKIQFVRHKKHIPSRIYVKISKLLQ